MGGFRWKCFGLALFMVVTGAMAGCKSNSGSAINDEPVPTTDTGFIAAGTTGGDAAGTANMKLGEGQGAEHMQGSHDSPSSQGGH